MKLSQFKFKLPEDKIALHPMKYRDESLSLIHILFSQTLNYQEAINDISPCYNGNISSLFWRTAQNNASNALISSPEKG